MIVHLTPGLGSKVAILYKSSTVMALLTSVAEFGSFCT